MRSCRHRLFVLRDGCDSGCVLTIRFNAFPRSSPATSPQRHKLHSSWDETKTSLLHQSTVLTTSSIHRCGFPDVSKLVSKKRTPSYRRSHPSDVLPLTEGSCGLPKSSKEGTHGSDRHSRASVITSTPNADRQVTISKSTGNRSFANTNTRILQLISSPPRTYIIYKQQASLRTATLS